jgi:hypothetical protein
MKNGHFKMSKIDFTKKEFAKRRKKMSCDENAENSKNITKKLLRYFFVIFLWKITESYK